MTPNDRDQTPADLAWVAERLEQERPMATPLELDRMKLRARSQAMRGARSQAKGSVLKSRVAIAAILMLGLLTGSTGTTLALSGSDNASQAQYGKGKPPSRVLGTTQQGGGGQGPSGVLGTTESSPQSSPQSSSNGVQGSQQVAAAKGGEELPFTGLAALPLIALGLGLMVVGGMLYRSARREPSSA